ncbi:MAG: chemotaxis protein CheW [Candidatus Hydrothermarchaeaceae archaeon]
MAESSSTFIEEGSEAEIQIVVFNMGDEEYGVDIHEVREIIKLTEITKVPRAPEFIEGVINLRGQITPIMDLRKRLGLQITEATDDNTRIIISEFGGSTAGMIVDSVTEVLRLSEKNIDTAPSVSKSTDGGVIKGVGKIDDRLLILLDFNTLLSQNEARELGSA